MLRGIRGLAGVRNRLGAENEARVVERFHRLYYTAEERTWVDTRWLGVSVLKCPLDLWVYQELIWRVRPEVLVETGTYEGGSALFLASCMDLAERGQVITIDTTPAERLPRHDRISYVKGSSTDPRILTSIREEIGEREPVMVILDSDHHCEHVLAELQAYSALVTPGSYLIVEDTNMNGRPILEDSGPGPYEAVELFLAGDPPFERDRSCEKFFMTFNPGGYLRRRDSV